MLKYPAPSVPEVTVISWGPVMVHVRLYAKSMAVWTASLNWTTTTLLKVSPYCES